MTALDDPFRPEADALYFVPLGGAGEIGMNLNLYGYGGKWLMVDLGIAFGDDTTPGIDVIMADPSFIAERRADLVGLVLTHAHEDHLGAVPYLWPELRCPVYATPFTAAVLRGKLHERGLAGRVPITEVSLGAAFEISPFRLRLVTVTHSIPEPSALVVETPLGRVLHTGDWKLDPDPIVGATTDEAALAQLGEEGVLAMLCDSTNAMVPGRSGSEAEVRESLKALFGRYSQRIAISCFATNVARLKSIAVAAAANGRDVALVGRSLWRIYEAARANGYLHDVAPFLSEHDAGYLPRDKIVLVCTGSQGEPRSALARIAAADHPEVSLEAGDTAIFSSREIPGNERAINRIQNLLVRLGVQVVTAEDEFVHVSGHPGQEELVRMYQWVRPGVAVPIHGEERHLAAHARLAQECQVPEALMAANGAAIRLAPGPAEIVAHVPSGRLAVDGNRVVPLDAGAMRGRHRMIHNGAAFATLVMTGKGELVADPKVAVIGLIDRDDGSAGLDTLAEAVRRAIEAMPSAARRDDESVRQAARIAVRRSLNASQGKKPVTEVHLIRL
jgi:ribonuclease J